MKARLPSKKTLKYDGIELFLYQFYTYKLEIASLERNKKGRNSKNISQLKNPINGKLEHDTEKLSNIMNEDFSSIGPNLA